MSDGRLSVGSVLEGTPFRLVELLGRSANAEVFRAEHVTLRKRVLVKLNERTRDEDPRLAERMRLEAQALARLQHPNLMEVIDTGVASGRPFIVMEDEGGRLLSDVLASGTPLEPAECVAYACDLLDGLGFAHESGLVHRDIQPQNSILVPRAGRRAVARILDFGLVKVLGGQDRHRLSPLAMPTAFGATLGSPRYMAPEQARGESVDFRADLYGLGAVLFHMLAGRDPFAHHDGLARLTAAHIAEVPAAPSAHAPGVGPALDAVVLRALAKSPAARFASAIEMRDALQVAIRDDAVASARALAINSTVALDPSSLDHAVAVARAGATPRGVTVARDAVADPTAQSASDDARWRGQQHGAPGAAAFSGGSGAYGAPGAAAVSGGSGAYGAVPGAHASGHERVAESPRGKALAKRGLHPVVALVGTSLGFLIVTVVALMAMKRCEAERPSRGEVWTHDVERLSSR